MGNKYIIIYKNYDTPYWVGDYKTNSYIKFIFKLFSLKRKYECIDIEIRK